MTASPAIHMIHVTGSHREVGAQIGSACAPVLREAVEFDAAIPQGRTRAEQLSLAERYLEVTAEAHPFYVDELEGAAEAAGVDRLALFACAVEEIWYEPRSRAVDGRCTDLVAAPPATAGDHVLVAHNNDMHRKYQGQLVAIEWEVSGDPLVLTIGNGIWISVGWNSAGLSLTGNELSPNDERIGVPREIQVRSMLRESSIDMMVGEALRHDRASSYNNVLASRQGDVVNVEGSAVSAEMTEPDERGHLVHTNHYVCDGMLGYESDPEYAARSAVRYRRASELLRSEEPGTVTAERLRTMLSDHENPPDALCRHPERWGGDTATAFWCVADVTDMRITFGRGNPCDSVAQEYAFAERG
jgi:isopenicillin-N N-acyltransferase like protein